MVNLFFIHGKTFQNPVNTVLVYRRFVNVKKLQEVKK